jgi:hypothetical protein
MKRSTRPFVFGLAAALAAFAVACDSPIAPDDHDDAEGFRLVVGGDVIYSLEPNATPATLTLIAGSATEVEVVFLDDHGDVMQLDADYSADIQITNETVVSWTPDPDNRFAGTLTAGSVGTTTLRVLQMHGGHADFQSPPIPVAVVAEVD